MNDIAETIERNQARQREAQALLNEARRVREERDRLFERAGITFQACVEFMRSDAIPPAAQARLREQAAQMEEKIAADAARIASAQHPAPRASTPRRFANRQMI